MKRAVPTGLTPPRPGLEREEPEIGYEHDIPPDDSAPAGADEPATQPEEQGPRQVERE